MKKKSAKEEIKKIGFGKALGNTLNVFGKSASQVFGSLSTATNQVLGETKKDDTVYVKKTVKKTINLGKKDLRNSFDDIIGNLPD